MSMRYRIERVRIHWGEMPVRLRFSYGKVDRFPFSIVRLDAGGEEGLGEVLVHPNDFLKGFLSSLVERDARQLDALLPPTDNDLDRILCESMSIALHDLVGRIAGLPLHTLLGGRKTDRVPLMPCVFPDGPAEAREKAAHFFTQGYKYLKTKLVGDLSEDLATVKAIRTAAPPNSVLQGDANEGYTTILAARSAVEKLGAAGLDLFEDPLRGGVQDYRILRSELRGKGAQVMVDKLARRTDDLTAVLRSEAADVIGIHPDQAGSLSRVMQHVSLTRAFGIPVVIGGTGYTGIGTAAYQHLTAVAAPDGPCGELGGLFDHGMPRSLVKQPLPMKDGAVFLSDGSGMGVTLDENALTDFEQGRTEWSKQA